MKLEDKLYIALCVVILLVGIFYFVFFWWPQCAFTPVAEAPVICLSR